MIARVCRGRSPAPLGALVFGLLVLLGAIAAPREILAQVDSPAGELSEAVEADEEPAGEAHALDEEHAEHESGPLLSADPGAAIWNLLIFLIVLLILAKFVWPPLLQGLQAREQKIRDELTDAEQANREARQLLEQYNQKLAATAEETQAMIAEARRDAEAAGQRIIEQARIEADRQRERAVAEIGSAKRAAMVELADQTTTLALRLARQVVGRELSQNDHADLIRQSLEELPSRS